MGETTGRPQLLRPTHRSHPLPHPQPRAGPPPPSTCQVHAGGENAEERGVARVGAQHKDGRRLRCIHMEGRPGALASTAPCARYHRAFQGASADAVQALPRPRRRTRAPGAAEARTGTRTRNPDATACACSGCGGGGGWGEKGLLALGQQPACCSAAANQPAPAPAISADDQRSPASRGSGAVGGQSRSPPGPPRWAGCSSRLRAGAAAAQRRQRGWVPDLASGHGGSSRGTGCRRHASTLQRLHSQKAGSSSASDSWSGM